DAGVLQLAGDARLRQEALAKTGVLLQLWPQPLQGHLPAHLGVARLPDAAHAPLADEPVHLEASDRHVGTRPGGRGPAGEVIDRPDAAVARRHVERSQQSAATLTTLLMRRQPFQLLVADVAGVEAPPDLRPRTRLELSHAPSSATRSANRSRMSFFIRHVAVF